MARPLHWGHSTYALEQLAMTLTRIAEADGFLVGNVLSIADLCLVPVIQRED